MNKLLLIYCRMSGGSGMIRLDNDFIIGHSIQIPRCVILSEMRCFDTNTWAFKIRCDSNGIIVRTATREFGHNGRIYYYECDGRIVASIHNYYKWKLFYMGIAQDGELNDVFFEMLKYYHLV